MIAANWIVSQGRHSLLSSCGEYEYAATEKLSDIPKICCFIMLNPAGVKRDKPGATRRNCIKFAEALGCGKLLTCNLFAYRAKKSKDLFRVSDPVGPENDRHVADMIRKSDGKDDIIVCAWGVREGRIMDDRVRKVVTILEAGNTDGRLHALRLNEQGRPIHPAARVSMSNMGVRLRIINGELHEDTRR